LTSRGEGCSPYPEPADVRMCTGWQLANACDGRPPGEALSQGTPTVWATTRKAERRVLMNRMSKLGIAVLTTVCMCERP
jgi:hypothetical protein